MKFVKRFFVLFCMLSLTLIMAASPAEAGRKWKAGGVAGPDTLDHMTLEKLCKLAGQKTGGKVFLDAYPSEQLGSWRDMFYNVVQGTQECGLLPLSPEFDKRLQAAYTVFLADTWEEGRRIYGQDGWMYKFLEPILLELGVKPLGIYFMGLDGFGSTKGPVVLPEDIKKQGIKVRTYVVSDRMYFEEAGAQAVDISFSELFVSLQTGVVDAQDNAPLLTYTHLRDVTKYYTDANIIFEPAVFMVNKELWDKQTPETRAALQAAVNEGISWGNAQAEDTAEEYLKKMEEHGIVVTRLTPEQRAEWKKVGIKSWDKFEEVVGKETMDLIRRNVSK